jgi:membrane-associated phospholipid phosphatase
MQDLGFDLPLIQYLFEHRTPALTAFFQVWTFLGDMAGYILVVALLFAAFDKRLAFRLAVLVLLTMSLNHLLKTGIANPRPFIVEGTYLQKWAVSASTAELLAGEFSTPSGHAMAGAAFYGYLYLRAKHHPWVKALAIAAILLLGLSRPYLGVHYLEDVLMGWVLGIGIALVAARRGERFAAWWNRFALSRRMLSVVGASLAVILATSLFHAASPFGPPLPIVSYLGFLTGILLAYPLEASWIGFDPRSASPVVKALRFALGAGLVIGTLALLDGVFEALASDASLLGMLLRYVRYAMAGIAGLLLAPFLFVQFGLAGRQEPSPQEARAA